MTKLKPCPFCGSTNIALIDDCADLCAECTDCHCRGAWGPTAGKAIVAWNHRTITKEQIEAMITADLAWWDYDMAKMNREGLVRHMLLTAGFEVK